MSAIGIFFGFVAAMVLWYKLTDTGSKPGVGELARKKAEGTTHKEPPPQLDIQPTEPWSKK